MIRDVLLALLCPSEKCNQVWRATGKKIQTRKRLAAEST